MSATARPLPDRFDHADHVAWPAPSASTGATRNTEAVIVV
jgi:hypothetical protein